MALLKPPKSSIVYEGAQVYACLASYPIARGHTIVAWKRPVRDLHLLSCGQLEHLMDVVDCVRDALLVALKLKNVYLLYMNEAQHVHWQLVPRWNEQGFDVFAHHPKRARTFPFAPTLRAAIAKALPRHPELH